MTIVEALLMLSILTLVAVYLLYPLSLFLLAPFFSRSHAIQDIRPTVTLIISAYNEARVIRAKLENALALQYPKELLEIMLISDASDDGTDEIALEFEKQGIVLKRQSLRCGKSAGLTRFVPHARGEVLVFSDANSMYDAYAIERLVRHFFDERVGYVVGHQRYSFNEKTTVSASERLYWNHEIFIKKLESRLGSVVGADGAMYAIRRRHFTPLDAHEINDFVNPLKIVSAGYWGIFDPTAFCVEDVSNSFRAEFWRKTRIVNRALRGLVSIPSVLNPLRVGWFAYQVIFHKLLRWFTPYFLVTILLTNFLAIAHSSNMALVILLVAQMAFYLAAATHAIPMLRKWKCVYLPYFFVLSNTAAFVGTMTAFTKIRFATWTPDRQN